MMIFIIAGLISFGLTFALVRYQDKLQEQHQKLWKKTVNYIRYTSLTVVLAGVLYVPEAQILKISGWLLVFSLLVYFCSLYMIYYKNKY